MLAVVVLDSFGESKAGVAERHVWLVVSAATDAVEAPDGEHFEVRQVHAVERPGIATELAARRVVRVGGEDAHARRVSGAIFGRDVAYDVIRHAGDDRVSGVVQTLGELLRSVESLLLGGDGGEDDRRVEPLGKALGEDARQLDDRRRAGT